MVKAIDRKRKLLDACKHLDRYLEKRYDIGLNLIYLSVEMKCSEEPILDALRFQLERDLLGVDMVGAEALMEKSREGIQRAGKYLEFFEAYRKEHKIGIIEEKVIYYEGHQLLFAISETPLELNWFDLFGLRHSKELILQWLFPVKEKYNMRLYQVLNSLEPSHIPIAETVLLDLARKADWIIPRIDGNAICLDFQKGENMRSPTSSSTVICCIQNEGVAK